MTKELNKFTIIDNSGYHNYKIGNRANDFEQSKHNCTNTSFTFLIKMILNQ